jgi:hypothetical protein
LLYVSIKHMQKVSNMSDVILFHSTNSKILPTKISLKLLSNGHIFVDWKDLPKHRNIRQCVIHYKSLNTNQVKFFFVILLEIFLIFLIRVMLYVYHVKNKILFYEKFNQVIYMKYMYVLLIVRIEL